MCVAWLSPHTHPLVIFFVLGNMLSCKSAGGDLSTKWQKPFSGTRLLDFEDHTIISDFFTSGEP